MLRCDDKHQYFKIANFKKLRGLSAYTHSLERRPHQDNNISSFSLDSRKINHTIGTIFVHKGSPERDPSLFTQAGVSGRKTKVKSKNLFTKSGVYSQDPVRRIIFLDCLVL